MSTLSNIEFFIVEWGKPFLKQIQNEVGEDFSYYEIDIEINENTDKKLPNTRNYSLKDLGPLY